MAHDEAYTTLEHDDARGHGPWDYSNRPLDDDDPRLIDLGSLLLVGHPDIGVQLAGTGEGDAQVIHAAVLVAEESALELRVFAAARSGAIWDELRPEIIEEITSANGAYEHRDGPWGPELLASVPVQTEDEKPAVQASRIIGIDGPRWFLRATVLGEQAQHPTDEGLLMDALRDVVVNRGHEARMVREPLELTVPEDAVRNDGAQ